MPSRAAWSLAIKASTVLVLIICAWFVLELPPQPVLVSLPPGHSANNQVVKGAFHVHTNRSDGSGSVEDVAAAARSAGLEFVIFTDHGNGTRTPDRPRYLSGVLCLDGVEISTRGGHYIAVGLREAAPYPLGGDAEGVVADVRRLGGFGVVAHPFSPKKELRWTDWSLNVDGVEWLNGDNQWRDKSWPELLLAATRYAVRPSPALATLLDRPETSIRQWDTTASGSIVGLGGMDAHAWNQGRGVAEALPSYEEIFRTFAIRAELDRPWTGRAGGDAKAVLDALRGGRTFTAIDAFGSPVEFTYTGLTDGLPIAMGGRVSEEIDMTLRATAIGPPGTKILLFADGQHVKTTTESELSHAVKGQTGGYRVEVRLPTSDSNQAFPWIMGNPIYVGSAPPFISREQEAVSVVPLAKTNSERQFVWHSEHDDLSSGDVVLDEEEVVFKHRLSVEDNPGRVSAAVYPLQPGALVGFDGVVFEGRANRPMRLSAQLRAGGLDGEPRWRQSFFLDENQKTIRIALKDLTSVEKGEVGGTILSEIDSFLIVTDLTNGTPGVDGEARIKSPRIEAWKSRFEP